MNPCRRPAKPDGGAAWSSPAGEIEFLSWAISLDSYCGIAGCAWGGPRPGVCRLHQLFQRAASTGNDGQLDTRVVIGIMIDPHVRWAHRRRSHFRFATLQVA